jgi:hypothetical protein
MSNLFARRLVIVVPPYGIPIIAGAILYGLVRTPMLANSVVCFILSVTALLVTIAARRSLREFRYSVHAALNDIENEDIPDVVEVSDSHEIVLKPLKAKVNGTASDNVRVSE